jgi:hypothetical protein
MTRTELKTLAIEIEAQEIELKKLQTGSTKFTAKTRYIEKLRAQYVPEANILKYDDYLSSRNKFSALQMKVLSLTGVQPLCQKELTAPPTTYEVYQYDYTSFFGPLQVQWLYYNSKGEFYLAPFK